MHYKLIQEHLPSVQIRNIYYALHVCNIYTEHLKYVCLLCTTKNIHISLVHTECFVNVSSMQRMFLACSINQEHVTNVQIRINQYSMHYRKIYGRFKKCALQHVSLVCNACKEYLDRPFKVCLACTIYQKPLVNFQCLISNMHSMLGTITEHLKNVCLACIIGKFSQCAKHVSLVCTACFEHLHTTLKEYLFHMHCMHTRNIQPMFKSVLFNTHYSYNKYLANVQGMYFQYALHIRIITKNCSKQVFLLCTAFLENNISYLFNMWYIL